MAMDGGMRAFLARDATQAWRALVELRPDRSAHRRLTFVQMAALLAAVTFLGWALWRWPGEVWIAAHAIGFVFFAAAIALRLSAAALAEPLPIVSELREDAP